MIIHDEYSKLFRRSKKINRTLNKNKVLNLDEVDNDTFYNIMIEYRY